MIKKIFNTLGLDHLGGKYRYDRDEQFGYMSKEKIPERWVKTTCGYCSVGCGMLIGVRDNKAVSVKGDLSHPVNYGKLCPKGLSEHYSIHSPRRALNPLVKVKNKHVEISWDKAIDLMIEKFRGIQVKYGDLSLGVVSTGQLVTEEFYTLGKLVQLGFGTKNYDGNTTLCMSTAVAGYKRSFGSDGPPGSYEDFRLSDCIILIGANIAENHPILTCWLDFNMNPDKKLIVIDPRVTKTTMLSDIHLPLNPRTDIALLNGIMHILLKEELYNRKYIKEHTMGFHDFAQGLEEYTPERVSEITGLPIHQIVSTAMTIGKANSVMVAWTMGVNHSDQGTETVNVINNLSLMLGQVGQKGSSPFSITGQCNAMGTRETSSTSSLPGYRSFDRLDDRLEMAELWKIDSERIPKSRGLAYPDIIEGAIQGKIKGLWVIATNPLVSYPNQDFLQDALSRLDFLVVQDGFHPTPTTEHADLILPSAIWGEKEGVFTNSERRVSKVNKAINPPGVAKSDFDIFLMIAEKLGVRDELYPGWATVADAFNEIKLVTKDRLCDYSGMSYDLIEKVGGIQWPFPCSDKEEKYIEQMAKSTKRLYSDGQFQTEDKKARFFKVVHKSPPEIPNEEYPLWLNTGRTVQHWHTRTKTGEIDILKRLSPEAWLEMNPLDAKQLNLKPDDKVCVRSQRGEIREITLRITETIREGQIFIPFHWVETNANNLTINAFDPISREPNFKQCAVRVEKLQSR